MNGVAVRPVNGLALCAGVGGLELGLHLALGDQYRTVGHVERDAYAAAVLVARMEDQTLAQAPIWDDLATFDGKPWRGVVDCISGGYPCQPFSSAGLRQGLDDERHLWPHIARSVAEVEPEWCVFENVAGHLRVGFSEVHDDLRALGYRVAAGLFTALEVGAPHMRQRLFIVARADPDRDRREGVTESDRLDRGVDVSPEQPDAHGLRDDVPDPERVGREGRQQARPAAQAARRGGPVPDPRSFVVRAEQGRPEPRWPRTAVAGDDGTPQPVAHTPSVGVGTGLRQGDEPGPREQRPVATDGRGSAPDPDIIEQGLLGRYEQPQASQAGRHPHFWAVEPDVGRVADGLACRVDRLRCIGNGVVPAVAARAWWTLAGSLGWTPNTADAAVIAEAVC